MKNHSLFLFLALTFAALPTLCFAAAASEYAIHVQDAVEYLVALVFGVIGAIAGIVATWVKNKTGLKLSAETEVYLDYAIKAGLAAAEKKAISLAQNIKDPSVKSQLIAESANFILSSVPALLGKIGLTREELEARIEAALLAKGALHGTSATGE